MFYIFLLLSFIPLDIYPYEYSAPATNSWKFPKCKVKKARRGLPLFTSHDLFSSLLSHQGPSYLRKISADMFELVGVQGQEDDLSDLVDYDDKMKAAKNDGGSGGDVCGTEEKEGADDVV